MKNPNEIEKAVSKYSNIFMEFLEANKPFDSAALNEIRKKAIERLDLLKFPNAKTEEWRQTSVRKLLNEDFNVSAEKRKLASGIKEKLILQKNKRNLIFVDGYCLNAGEFNNNLPEGAYIGNLQSAIGKVPDVVLKYFDKYLDYSTGFEAVNTAFVKDGLFVYLPEGTIIEEPVQVLFFFERENELSSLRNLIALEANSGVDLVINYLGKPNAKYFVNGANEIAIGENSRLNIFEIQEQSRNSYHVQKSAVYQESSSALSHFEFTFSGGLIRNDVKTKLDGENIECNLQGLYIVKGKEHVDNHTVIEHLKPNSFSFELYKGILKDEARGVFSGRIFVDPSAQKTNAYQSNKNILLSEKAVIDTKPQLEIYADDVKCSHGATVGKLEEQALFYFKSRGISEDIAKSMLIQAFASDIIERVKFDELREYLNSKISRNLKEVKLNDG